MQVDLLSELVGEPLVGPQAALPELDVDRVGELRAHAARRLAGRPGAEGVALEEHHLGDARARQVVRRAQPHHAAPDHHDRGAGRELSHGQLSEGAGVVSRLAICLWTNLIAGRGAILIAMLISRASGPT